MELKFRKLSLEDKPAFDAIVAGGEQPGWEYDFGMLWAWDVFDETQIALTGDAAVVYNVFYGKPAFFPPFVRDEASFAGLVDKIADYCDERHFPFLVNGVTHEQAGLLDPGRYEITPDRNNFDYLYSVRDLTELRGKKFHAKRNYITRFEASYGRNVRPYEARDLDGMLELYDRWYHTSVHETLDVERRAIERALRHSSELGLKIAVLEADGKLAAYSVNSVSGAKVAHTFFEKGDINYVGVYQAINKYAAEMFFDGKELVNRQEDMGIEGLRKVKLSYNPVMLLEKNRITKKV